MKWLRPAQCRRFDPADTSSGTLEGVARESATGTSSAGIDKEHILFPEMTDGGSAPRQKGIPVAMNLLTAQKSVFNKFLNKKT